MTEGSSYSEESDAGDDTPVLLLRDLVQKIASVAFRLRGSAKRGAADLAFGWHSDRDEM